MYGVPLVRVGTNSRREKDAHNDNVAVGALGADAVTKSLREFLCSGDLAAHG